MKSAKSDVQKAFIQEKRNTLTRRIRRWQQVQFVYMPGVVAPSHETGADDDGTEHSEQTPLILPSAVQSTRRDTICLHRVAEYEQKFRLAQLQDSLTELRLARRIRHSLLLNHQTQIAGQGQRPNTRSRTVVTNTEDRIAKFAKRYRAAYHALLQLDPTGEWRETYLELKEEDNRGPGKEEHEQRLGDGTYTFSWLWLLNPRAHNEGEGNGGVGASDEEVNDAMRVQWTTSQARMERWAEETELLQEEMWRVVTFLEWKSEYWLEKQNTRLTTAVPSIQSGLKAYAHKQAGIHHDLAVSFSKLWRPTLVSNGLEHSWVTQYMEKHGISPDGTDTPTVTTQDISQMGALSGLEEGRSTVTTLQVPSRDSSDVNMADDTPRLLEEMHYVEDEDEDEDNTPADWDISGASDSDSGDDSDDDGDDDSGDDGFDSDWGED